MKIPRNLLRLWRQDERRWLAVLQPTEWQRIGNQIGFTPVFPWFYFVSIHQMNNA
jgi:hypothetical protein